MGVYFADTGSSEDSPDARAVGNVRSKRDATAMRVGREGLRLSLLPCIVVLWLCSIWVPEGSLAGFFWGAFLRSGRPRGPGTTLKKVGASPPADLRAFPGPGAGQTSKTHPTNPARLPSGTHLEQPQVAPIVVVVHAFFPLACC